MSDAHDKGSISASFPDNISTPVSDLTHTITLSTGSERGDGEPYRSIKGRDEEKE